MSAHSEITIQTKLEALQCHFTWDIHLSETSLVRFKDKLDDIGADEGNSWLGHVYNLQGFIHHKMGLDEDAQSFFSRAAGAFRQTRKTASGDGPWLLVTYGNQAWLHHRLGEEAESQAYLAKVDALMSEHPPPSQDELHPEIYAEKAWTLMKFRGNRELVVDLFQKAIKRQPHMVEWQTSNVIASATVFKYSSEPIDPEFMKKMSEAKGQDPENLYLAVLYLDVRARMGQTIEDDARELAKRVLKNPVSSYSGLKGLLMVYMKHGQHGGVVV